MDGDECCNCSQEERMATGWGARLANWSPFNAPEWIRVHYGCDRPLYGHNELMHQRLSPHVKLSWWK